MKPSNIATAVRHCFQAKAPDRPYGISPIFMGPPGIGKTECVKSLTEEFGEMLIVHGLTHDAVDVHGFPKVIEDVDGNLVTKFSRPGFWPMGPRGILFLDEFCSAPGLVQSAFSQLLLNHRIGEHILPPEWHIVLASNRMSDRAIVHQIPSNIANRIVFIDFEVDLDDWTTASMNAGKRAEVIAFCRFAPDALHDFDPQGKKAKDKSTEHAFPSPRSWWFVSDLLDTNPPPGIEVDLIQGTVGKGRGTEFISFLRMYRDAPSLDAILINPGKAQVPEKLSIKYAVAIGLARRMDVTNIKNCLVYLNRLPKDINVMAVKTASERDPKVANTNEFRRWAVENKEDLFVSHL